MTGGREVLARWTTGRLSTGSRPSAVRLWKAVDSGGRAAPLLTCGNAGFCTIHRPYYCS